MKKSLIIFCLFFIGTLTISASVKEEILGKWYVKSMEMMGETEVMEDELTAPWMEFKKDGVLLLGEEDRKTDLSKWSFDNGTQSIRIESFGEDVELSIVELTDKKLILEASNKDGEMFNMVLVRASKESN